MNEYHQEHLTKVLCSSIPISDSLRSDPDLPSFLLQFCKQVVDGLACLAGKSFVHRDIAARNILLDQELNCKVSSTRGELWAGRMQSRLCESVTEVEFCLLWIASHTLWGEFAAG